MLLRVDVFSALGCEGIFPPVLHKKRFHNLVPPSKATNAKQVPLPCGQRVFLV